MITILISLILSSTISESYVHRSSSAPFKPNTLILPVMKDFKNNLFATTLHKRTPQIAVPLVLDLNGRILWLNCDDNYLSSTYRAPICHSVQCARAGAHSCHKCGSSPTPRPGCHNNTCSVIATNPITLKNSVSELALDVVTIRDFNGSSGSNASRRWATDPHFMFACAPSSLLQGPLQHGVRGIAGLGNTPVSLPVQLASRFGFRPEFALCLSPWGIEGTMLIGNIPPRMLPKIMFYTPLTVGAQGDYSIRIRSISINNKNVPFNTSLFSKTKGFGDTIISTTVYQTVMEHSIYKELTQFYVRELSRVPRAPAVPPYGLCFFIRAIWPTAIPDINLYFQNRNVRWRIRGYDSLFYVTREVACLRFVDGGTNVRAPITIGSHMLESTFVHFDLARSRFGFTPNWSQQNIYCEQYYNFTANPHHELHNFDATTN
ncbi:hypothetical protein ABFS82_02G100300 [Erythranthe guttata]